MGFSRVGNRKGVGAHDSGGSPQGNRRHRPAIAAALFEAHGLRKAGGGDQTGAASARPQFKPRTGNLGQYGPARGRIRGRSAHPLFQSNGYEPCPATQSAGKRRRTPGACSERRTCACARGAHRLSGGQRFFFP